MRFFIHGGDTNVQSRPVQTKFSTPDALRTHACGTIRHPFLSPHAIQCVLRCNITATNRGNFSPT